MGSLGGVFVGSAFGGGPMVEAGVYFIEVVYDDASVLREDCFVEDAAFFPFVDCCAADSEVGGEGFCCCDGAGHGFRWWVVGS